MKRLPFTQQEAEEYRYPTIKGQHKAYVHGQCAYACHYKWGIEIQCPQVIKNKGYGPGGLYCKQHASMVRRSLKKNAKMKDAAATAAPTQIIKEPEMKKVSTRGGKRLTRIFTCNDGKVYTLTELSEATSIPVTTIAHRLKKYPWQSKMILLQDNLRTIEERIDPNEWEGLSGKVRNDNLLRLKIGSWERSQIKYSQGREKH
jgi:hypothetical protein